MNQLETIDAAELISAYNDYLNGNKSKMQRMAHALTKEEIHFAAKVLCEKYKTYDGHHVMRIVKLLTCPFED